MRIKEIIAESDVLATKLAYMISDIMNYTFNAERATMQKNRNTAKSFLDARKAKRIEMGKLIHSVKDPAKRQALLDKYAKFL